MRFFCRFMGNWIRGRNNSPLNKQPSINNPKSPSYHYTIQCVLRNLYNIRLTVLSLNNTHSEAWIGIEPTNNGFADRCLTTWLPGHMPLQFTLIRLCRRRATAPNYLPLACPVPNLLAQLGTCSPA